MGELEIEKLFLLDHLSDNEKDTLLSNTTRVVYSKGERIVKKGEFVTHLVYIVRGYVKIHSEHRGKEIILNIKGPETLAGISVMVTCEKHPFSITALEDSVICLIAVDEIRDLIEKNGKFAKQIIDHINDVNLEYLKHNLLSLTQNNIHGRLANALLYLMEKVFKKHIFEVMLSRVELAQFSKISRENVIKTLYEFASEGIIKLNGKQIEILNPEHLRKLSDYG